MKSPHLVISLFTLALLVGMISAIPADAQRGVPPPQAQGRGQSAKPTPPTPAPTPPTQAKGPMTPPQHLTQQPKLVAKLQPLFPPKTDLQLAAAGFKNLGEFIAAAHVAKNLDIPFDQLKARVTGTDSVSLGQAITELKPAVNANAEVRKAQAQAKKDQEGGKP